MNAVLRRSRPVTVTAAVLALYAAWIGAYLASGGDVRDFIRIGTHFIAYGHGRSSQIHLDRGYRPPANQNKEQPGLGYDGQFAYYVALDPSKARYYTDLPSYRYSHVLQPMIVRVLSFGQRNAIPWLLLLVNWLAVGAGTWALATWFRRHGMSPLWAAIYGLWPGVFVGIQRDLTEPLAYSLIPIAILLLESRSRWRLPTAAIAFGLAGLARQTTLVFPLVYALWIAFRGDVGGADETDRGPSWRRAAVLLALSFGPFAAYSAFLLDWLGSLGAGPSTPVPFSGLLHPPFRLTRQGIDTVFVVVPVLIALVAFYPRRRFGDPSGLPWFLLLGNVLVNLVFYRTFYNSTYTAVSRIAIGVMLSALLCLPYLDLVGPRRRAWLAGAAIVSMSLLPVVAVYGFTNISAPS